MGLAHIALAREQSMKLFKQGFTYSLIGMFATYIDLLLFNLLAASFKIYAGPLLLGFNALAFLGANLNSFFMNRRLTFQGGRGPLGRQYRLFLACSLGGLAINSLLVLAVTTLVPRPATASPLLWANCAKLTATGGSFLFNFFAYRQLVFRRTPEWTPRP